MEATLERYRIKDAPNSMFYISNFISEDEEANILQKIPDNRWVTLSHRRLQAIPARLTATNTLLASPLPEWLSKPVTSRFDEYGVFAGAPHGVNHCLVNEYLPGQGIMPHEDGAAYHPIVATISLGGSIVLDVTEKVRDALLAYVEREINANLGRCQPSSSVDGTPDTRESWRILQEPRSLLVTTGTAYIDTLHGIAEVTRDEDLNARTVANWNLLRDRNTIEANLGINVRTTRISLTYRDVMKVSKAGSKIFGKPRK